MSAHEMAYTRKVTLVDYGREVENEISKLGEIIEANPELAARYTPRWLAIKLLEEDSDILNKVKQADGDRVLSAARWRG